eukprot:1147376-Pelagomonas_calceolata.AAC.2
MVNRPYCIKPLVPDSDPIGLIEVAGHWTLNSWLLHPRLRLQRCNWPGQDCPAGRPHWKTGRGGHQAEAAQHSVNGAGLPLWRPSLCAAQPGTGCAAWHLLAHRQHAALQRGEVGGRTEQGSHTSPPHILHRRQPPLLA